MSEGAQSTESSASPSEETEGLGPVRKAENLNPTRTGDIVRKWLEPRARKRIFKVSTFHH